MFERLRKQAADNWAAWATTLADGGKPPAPLELLEAGGLLGIAQPADALEKDAAAVREVRDLEAQAAGLREQEAARRAPHGSQEERRQRIAALRAEIRRLESMSGVSPRQLAAGALLGDASRIRKKHPRVFRPAAPAAAKKTRRKKELV